MRWENLKPGDSLAAKFSDAVYVLVFRVGLMEKWLDLRAGVVGPITQRLEGNVESYEVFLGPTT